MEENKGKAQTWNDGYWGKTQTKAIQGLCALIIIFHHMAQKTCAPWIPEDYVAHGLEPFLNVGYLMVGVFFFCSGWGLYKSIKSKPDYLDGFIGNHFRPIILLFILANLPFLRLTQSLSSYSWFIYAILYLYLAFYISFKKIKSERNSILLLLVFTMLYIAVCSILMIGTWCYNTVGIFLVGLVLSRNDEAFTAFIRRRYLPSVIVAAAVLVGGFIGAIRLNNISATTESTLIYDITGWSVVFLQFASSLAFVMLLFIISQKLVIKSRILNFLGSMTLEIYLSHVIFVEYFGYCFVDEKIEAPCYISNLLIYIPAVLAAGLICAYGLWWIKRGAHYLHDKYESLFHAIGKDAKKILIGVLIVLAIAVIVPLIGTIVERDKLEAKIKDYTDKYITFVPYDPSAPYGGDNDELLKDSAFRIACYVAGDDAGQTIMLLRSIEEPCPTLTQRLFADSLAEYYRVILVDFLGSGFSSDTDIPRTAENICKELHAVAEWFELEDYTLLAEDISAMYAQYYVNRYPHEVSTVITLDAEFASIGRAGLAIQKMSIPQYQKQLNVEVTKGSILYRVISTLGLKNYVWPLYSGAYTRFINLYGEDVIKELYLENKMNSAYRSEQANLTDSYLETEALKYPDDVTVIDLVREGRAYDYQKRGVDFYALLDVLSENAAAHKTIEMGDCLYYVIMVPNDMCEIVVDALEDTYHFPSSHYEDCSLYSLSFPSWC